MVTLCGRRNKTFLLLYCRASERCGDCDVFLSIYRLCDRMQIYGELGLNGGIGKKMLCRASLPDQDSHVLLLIRIVIALWNKDHVLIFEK